MIERNDPKKAILRELIGEIERQPACGTLHAQEQLEFRTVRKMIEGNKETLSYLKTDDPRVSKLTYDNEFLNSLLPKYLTVAGIKSLLTGEIIGAIRTSQSEGKAIGEAMKFLKTQEALVDGKDVAEVVKDIRGAT
jgi:hypothetical protein